MAKPPFKIAQPAPRNPGSEGQAQRRPYNPAKTAKHAMTEGETLVEAGQENMQPDGDVGDATPDEAGQEHCERPVYPAANPWPAAKAVAHKPFKL